ncbi:MAG: ACP phosphodiesterase, partial [Chitinophagaceae bacterium]
IGRITKFFFRYSLLRLYLLNLTYFSVPIQTMNFLAHAYLSFNRTPILRGNLLGDFVKGDLRQAFTEEERVGLALHRFIDQFTDQHHAFQEARQRMRPAGIMGAGVFVDIIFDHMLAKHETYFSETELLAFSQAVYQVLPLSHPHTPPRALVFFKAMQEHNWLYHYRFTEGTEKSLKGMCHRYPRLGKAETVIELFHQHYTEMDEHFNTLFPELEAACQTYLHQYPQIKHA